MEPATAARLTLTGADSEHIENSSLYWEGRMTRIRTLLRAGRNAHLVRVEGRGMARFYVEGPDAREPQDFGDLPAAVALFERVEREGQPQRL
jgi:hypothetical protein